MRQPPCDSGDFVTPAGLLCQAAFGRIGKTSLAKGFLRWLESTGGLRERVFWFNFQEIHSVEYIIDQMLSVLAGISAMAKPMVEKLPVLAKLLRDKPYLLIWDNFESASGIEGTEIKPQLSAEDRNILAQLLKKLRGGKTKMLITSRNREGWLQIQSCYRLPLGGLTGEDLWEYCNAVVRDLGLTLDREDKTYAGILEKLCGNPLAIRAILLRLQDCSATQLLAELESSFEGMEGDESTRRLDAAYMVFGKGLTERFLPVLQLTGLYEYYLDADYTKAMLDSAGNSVEADLIDCCYHILENAGFCTHIGQNIYRLHPALRGYLLRQTPAAASVQKGFVDIMGRLADSLVRKPLHEVRYAYQINTANFYYARRLAEVHKMNIDYMALTQSLAHHAQEMRRFEEANKLYTALAEWANSYNGWDSVAMALHQRGIIAQEQRDFAAAEAWYKKSLAIKKKQGNEYGVAGAYHQLGRIAEERRDFPRAADLYLKALKILADANDPYNLMITIRSYARLLHDAAGTERNQLRERWSKYMDQELTKILEQMEVELYGTGN